ncbi:MAG: hydroxymethylbilane synthase [Bacteroidetes bacterium]|nr:hydroxymethylbilane synthase [Bacteroidota bacterium]
MSLHPPIKIGTRDSELAIWQASEVQKLLALQDIPSTLVPIKSEGDLDLKTPLYAMGVQGVFTRALDIALLNDRIDMAVHSMKDVPVQLPQGVCQAAVLKRASHKDMLVFKEDSSFLKNPISIATIATSSLRRKAQWLHQYPYHRIEVLRGNIHKRLEKLENEKWDGALFAAAGLDRLSKRPAHSIELDWMLPAPAQGAIMVVCKEDDTLTKRSCQSLNDLSTARCVKIERDFLKALMGGCSAPISALAIEENGNIHFSGNIFSPDGKDFLEVEKKAALSNAGKMGEEAAEEIISKGGLTLLNQIKNAGK